MEKQWDIFGIGTAAVDDLIFIDHFPMPDSKMPVREVQRHGGGQTATALVAAARHRAKTAFCACLDDDDLSRFTLETLQLEGVNCSTVFHIPGSRPVHSIILVETHTGTRTILFDNQHHQEPYPESIKPEWIAQSKVVFFDQNAPRAGLFAARLAKELMIPVIADLEKIDLPDMDAVLANIDHLIVSSTFAAALTRETKISGMMQKLILPERAATIITCGKDGCWFSERDSRIRHFPAYQVNAVDTTGCGDVFHGVYAAAIVRGETVVQAVSVASAAAALKTSQPGGRAGIPDLETARLLVRRNIIHSSTI